MEEVRGEAYKRDCHQICMGQRGTEVRKGEDSEALHQSQVCQAPPHGGQACGVGRVSAGDARGGEIAGWRGPNRNLVCTPRSRGGGVHEVLPVLREGGA